MNEDPISDYDKKAELFDLFAERYGFAPWDMAELSLDEIKLYQRGMERREEQKERQSNPNRRTKVSADQRRREEEALRQYA